MSSDYRPPPPEPLEIIFLDDALLVLNKPSGLLSVPGRGPEKADCLLSRANEDFPEGLIVHRLDMETSGVMVLARSKEVHRRMSIAFEARLIEKEYNARVSGCVKDDAGQIDLPLSADWPNRPLQKVDHTTGKPSLTKWQVIQRDAQYTHLVLKPITGRSHQLRVHLNAIGHPILGDSLYGTVVSKAAAPRLQLHASMLSFAHPVSGEPLDFLSPAPF